MHKPGVFTDVKTEAHSFYIEYERFISGREIALFVEHRIVRQIVLAVSAERLAIDDDGRRVKALAVFQDGVADDHVRILEVRQLRDERFELLCSFCVE